MDCFDLLGETEHKTELQLKNRIDKAVTCSPCILLLKHLDALARKSQALETGQGNLFNVEVLNLSVIDDYALQNQLWRQLYENVLPWHEKVLSPVVILS